MNLLFHPITLKNRQEALQLKVAQSQEHFIESVAQCLAEADQSRVWHPLGIYDGQQIVGFTMYGFFAWESFPFGRLWLDRLLIDKNDQGKGYGKAALKGMLELLSFKYPNKSIYLSVISGNDVAVRLYKQFGFQFTDRKDKHGEEIMVRKTISQT